MTQIKLNYIFWNHSAIFEVSRGLLLLSYHNDSKKMNKLSLTKGWYVVSKKVCKGRDILVRELILPLDKNWK